MTVGGCYRIRLTVVVMGRNQCSKSTMETLGQSEVWANKLLETNSQLMWCVCVIWYYSYNLKNAKNTHKGVLLLVKLQVTLLHWCFSRFLDCTNGIKSRNAPQMFYVNWKYKKDLTKD